MKVGQESDRLHPYPRGWYAVDTACDLQPGELRHSEFMGQQIVYYRGASGKLAAMDAYCAHMGAHLGHGGWVEGNNVVCPFHAFQYASDGRLLGAPNLKRCPKLRQKTYPVDEKWGYVMLWNDPDGEEPSWYVPPVVDTDTWSKPLIETLVLDVHPVDAAENAVDMRHFPVLHHNTFKLDDYGAINENEYNIRYGGRILDENVGLDLYHRLASARIDVHLLGIGLLNARVTLPKMGLAFHYLLSPMPLDENRTQLLIGVNMKRSLDVRGTWIDRTLPFLRGEIPLPGVDRLVRLWRADFLKGQLEDEPIWGNKRYLAKPGFMDPPVRDFRRWASNFIKPLHPEAREQIRKNANRLPVDV